MSPSPPTCRANSGYSLVSSLPIHPLPQVISPSKTLLRHSNSCTRFSRRWEVLLPHRTLHWQANPAARPSFALSWERPKPLTSSPAHGFIRTRSTMAFSQRLQLPSSVPSGFRNLVVLPATAAPRTWIYRRSSHTSRRSSTIRLLLDQSIFRQSLSGHPQSQEDPSRIRSPSLGRFPQCTTANL